MIPRFEKVTQDSPHTLILDFLIRIFFTVVPGGSFPR